MGDTRAPLAVTACRLCREQKVRCSHEQPTCARCSKLGLECAYPEPPDRRLIAAQRVQSKKRSVRDSRDSLTVHQSQPKRPRSSPHALHGHPQPPPQSQAVGTQVHELTSLPQASPEALRILQDAYFTSTFNSTLTFHFPTFQDDEANGSVPRHTALAMQALGANFISPLTAQGKQHYSVMRHLGDLRHVADTWALAAGKLALQEADEPTLYMVRTCQMLSLFWFSRGDSRRNTMFSGIGYKAVRAIVVESMDRVKTMPSNDGFDSSPERSRAHKVECLRRLFWASWITNIINSDHYVPGSARDTLVLTLPLPISETAYRHQIEEPLTTISETFMACQSSDRPVQEPSIMAEIMKCLIIWARIRDHIDSRRHFPQKEAWHNVYSIQKDIDIWRRQLHPELKYSKRNLYHQLVVKQQPTFVMFHAIHHQCLLVLNSALVPHFSGIPMPQDIPFEAVRVSAALVLQSARALANMSAHLVALEWDPTQIAPFFGYCMYASASMQISALPRRCGTESQAWEGLTNCMKLLKLMKPYWAVLNRLWTRILPLYETQVANFRRAAATSPEHPYNAREDEDDLSLAAAEEEEFLTSPKEDNGNPQDSAEASALQYSLRTLAKDAPTSSDRSNSQMRETTCVAAEGTDQTLFPAGTGATQAVFADLAETRQGAVEQSLKPVASADPSALHVPVKIDVVQTSPYNQVGEPSLPFEPLQIAFQSSFGSLEAFDMTGLEDNNWLQLDMDSSLQARQAFNHLF